MDIYACKITFIVLNSRNSGTIRTVIVYPNPYKEMVTITQSSGSAVLQKGPINLRVLYNEVLSFTILPGNLDIYPFYLKMHDFRVPESIQFKAHECGNSYLCPRMDCMQ